MRNMDPLRARANDWGRVIAAADDAMTLLALRDVGVFEALLAGPRSAARLGAELGVGARRLRSFLDVAVSMGFLDRCDGDGDEVSHGESDATVAARYALTAADEALFREPGARALLPSEDCATTFSRRAQAPRVLSEDIGLDVASSGGDVEAQERREFLTYLDRHARAEASELAQLLDGPPVARFADLGCGAGTYAIALLSRWPQAEALLVDRPNAEALVTGALAETELSGRARFLGADLLSESWTAGVAPLDLVLISNMLHNVGPDACAALVSRAAALLAPGGRLVLKDFTVRHDRLGPPGGLRFALLMALCSDGGDLYSAPEIAGWARDAGLAPEPPVQLMTAPESFVLVARKPEARDA